MDNVLRTVALIYTVFKYFPTVKIVSLLLGSAITDWLIMPSLPSVSMHHLDICTANILKMFL